MTQPLKIPSRGVGGRVIDWSEVSGFVLDWAFAIGELAFAVLASGLVGGMFGSAVDVALAAIREDWVGYGRMVGWTTGAVSTAIGMPLGWARGDAKRWSLPTPRKLRKNVTAKARKRRKQPSTDFKEISDVLQGGVALGLIGGVFGGLLGGALLLGWFSLAMSPFASTEWFDAIEFQSAREFHDDSFRRDRDTDGMVVSTDDPIGWHLFFSPVLILGVAGAIFGTAYGAVQHIGYLINVPTDVRERHRQEKRRPVVEQRQATAAAIEQRLQPLAPAPRAVPAGARRQLLRDGAGAGMLIGAIFFVAGVVASVLLFFGWRNDPVSVPLVALTFGAIFLLIGTVFLWASFRDWQSKMRILRHGYVTRCRIVRCQHPQTGGWRSYETLLEEFRAAWDKPLANYNTKADTQSFERFATFFGVASVVVFGFMGLIGVVLTVAFVYAAVVEGEMMGWVGIAFLALWWTVLAIMARLFWRNIRLARNVGSQSLKTLGIKPVVNCRLEFALPDGKMIKSKMKVDLAYRNALKKPEPDDVAAYDPWEPTKALLLSWFTPPLEVGEDGHWRNAVAD